VPGLLATEGQYCAYAAIRRGTLVQRVGERDCLAVASLRKGGQ